MKSKEEYLEEYRKEHGTKTYMAFQIIFQLIGGIIMIISTINLVNGRKKRTRYFYNFINCRYFSFFNRLYIFKSLSKSRNEGFDFVGTL